MPTKVLYAVLNWGLGHASRSIPIIEELIKQKIPLVIASDGEALLLLQKEFPTQIFETLPSYNIRYSEKAKDFDKTIFLQLNKLGKTIKAEQKKTKELIKTHRITHIISDNRYGVYSIDYPSVIVCHQMTLMHKNSFSKFVMNKVHFSLLNKFNKIWVPDFKGKNCLAGDISKTKNKHLKQKIKYIGALSRMTSLKKEFIYDITIMLSGPEPQRTLLETILLSQVNKNEQKIAFVRGVSSTPEIVTNKNISVFNMLQTEALNEIINNSKFVVCRAGYSSIMDLVKLNKKALLIPTPGQTEQEYLAKFLDNSGLFLCVNQNNISLNENLKTLEKINESQNDFIDNNLTETINNFLTNFA